MKEVIFIDIDGTLLDSRYKANNSAVISHISQLQKNGVLFALNSNRSLEDIIPVAKRFAIDGPLVCENGMFYATASDTTERLLVPIQTAKKACRAKVDFEKRLKEILDNCHGNSYVWIEADTVRLLSQEKPPVMARAGSLVFINNKFRSYTTSVHILYQSENGLVQSSPSIVNELCQRMANWADANDFVVTRGHELANILAYTKLTSKRNGVQNLRRIYPDVPFSAIGNEYYDAQMISGIGRFYAVGNATNEAKDAAAYTATSSTTQGVAEILHSMKANSKES